MLRPRFLSLVWVLLAAATLALPVFETQRTAALQGEVVTLEDAVTGWVWLVFGAGDPLAGRLAWLAHPVGLAAVGFALAKRRKAALAHSVAALAIAATTYTYVGATWQLGPGGATGRIIGLGAGYWVWLAFLAMPAFQASIPKRFGYG